MGNVVTRRFAADGKMSSMRRFVALLLLVLLPLQAVWAAAAPYCQHESDATSPHIGHHQPEHAHATAADAADAANAADALPAQGGDAPNPHSDCHTCHGGSVLAHEVSPVQVMSATAPPVPALAQGLPAPPTERPERPKWPALA